MIKRETLFKAKKIIEKINNHLEDFKNTYIYKEIGFFGKFKLNSTQNSFKILYDSMGFGIENIENYQNELSKSNSKLKSILVILYSKKEIDGNKGLKTDKIEEQINIFENIRTEILQLKEEIKKEMLEKYPI